MAVALLMALLMAACQPLPRPFGPEGDRPANPLLVLGDRGGIIVGEIADALEPAALALAGAMAKAMGALNIPAATSGGNRESRFLQGRTASKSAGKGLIEVELNWELADAGGTILGRHTATATVSRRRWKSGEAALMRSLAEASAPAVAALVQTPEPATAMPATPRPVHLWPITGSPGDGGRALGRALKIALKRARLQLVEELVAGGLVILGSVEVGAAIANRQNVRIEWSVIAPDGSELGTVQQENTVPKGALDGAWRGLVVIIAENAAKGIVALLERLRVGDTEQG